METRLSPKLKGTSMGSIMKYVSRVKRNRAYDTRPGRLISAFAYARSGQNHCCSDDSLTDP